MATAFVCPACGKADTEVKDSRESSVNGHVAIRRRRRCKSCAHSFTTFEVALGDIKHRDRVAASSQRIIRLARKFADDVEAIGAVEVEP